MDQKRTTFNPEYSYLENAELRALQFLIDDVIDLYGDKENKATNLQKIEADLNALYDKYKASDDQSKLKDLIKLVRDNLRILDKGGMSAGRSIIHTIISKLSKKALEEYSDLYFDKE